jgi:gliding motility-associated lipoprotein GldH
MRAKRREETRIRSVGKSREEVRIAKGSFIMAIVIAALSCDRQALYEQYVSLPDARWHADSTAVFTIDVPDTTNGYDLEVLLRSNEKFPYSNLYLFIEWQGENQSRIDTLEHLMALPEGKWTGKGYGALKENVIRYKMNYRFDRKEKVRLSFRQGMRDLHLNGVEDVGFRFSLSQENTSK